VVRLVPVSALVTCLVKVSGRFGGRLGIWTWWVRIR